MGHRAGFGGRYVGCISYDKNSIRIFSFQGVVICWNISYRITDIGINKGLISHIGGDGNQQIITDFVTFVSAVLEDNGASVVRAYSADEALEVARREKPDLMTLDISMPGRSGDEVFEEIRNDPDLKTMPVCIITGQPELRRLIYDRPVAPPEGYMDKPVDEVTLLFNIRKVLKLHYAEGVPADQKT